MSVDQRWVLYVDMDAFYVACERRDRPELAGRPVIVGPDPHQGPSRGVVLSASYEARAFGVRSAMPVAIADRRCPDATWIAADFPKYEAASRAIVDRLRAFSAEVHPLSIDEAALVVGARSAAEAEEIARRIQSDLEGALGLPCTIGGATSRVVAKIVTDSAKPRGIRVVAPEGVVEFLASRPVDAIPGVGPKTTDRLRAAGLTSIGEVGAAPRERLRRLLGGFGLELAAIARGEWADPPERPSGPRSRSVERTFPVDASELPALEAEVATLAGELSSLLERERLRYQTVTVGVRWSDFERVQRSRTRPVRADGVEPMRSDATELLRELWASERFARGRAVRTLSLGVERLAPRSGAVRPLEAFESARGRIK
ncbi:MAG TPA: DNA polymerase IV [Thermoplasmata archaeon]|nr:DNA polymerase IV [Thermoplasmata archaeon]